jgi:dihydropteroate synthase
MMLQLRNRILDISKPIVMGILNTTPDSFSDGGMYVDVETSLSRIREMITQGASIIDIGGESTRPGSDPVTVNEELQRTIPILERAVSAFPETIFSIDTVKYDVAKAALETGAHLVNDVSGLQHDPGKADLCASFNAGLVIMHSKGKPKEMQVNPTYEDVLLEIKNFFLKQIKFAENRGVKSIILDPGIGFGKTVEHNLKLIANLESFVELEKPILAGISRKSMIGALLDGRPTDGRLAGTLAAHYHCMLKGAKIIRVHDVVEAVDTIRILNAINSFE